ncbi:MAG: glycoside hydrolase family 3 C-terminal domain-containing protein [Lachnospiraceae bacterium]|nr:glycoside hydrolase family 3 C-terminal domain-containing protein [Lachnospiraceae bacterium]
MNRNVYKEAAGETQHAVDLHYSVEEFASLARRTVAEGCVLLSNEGQALPLKEGTRLALFGRSQFNYFKSGTGSGGLVNTAYVTGIKEALEACTELPLVTELTAVYEDWLKEHPFDEGHGWATEPWFQEEMPVSQELAAKIAKQTDTAVVILGRTAGEDKDNSAEPGSYLLTEPEETMLRHVCEAFPRTIVLLNVGNIIDMSWMDRCHPSAVLYVWQGGQEGGTAVPDLLLGRTSPSGHLPDTIAERIEDYPSTACFGDRERNEYKEDIYVGYRYFSTFAPEKVRFPFGYGLSYTAFSYRCVEIRESNLKNQREQLQFSVTVTNEGRYPGKEVLQLYAEKPQGTLGNPSRVLVDFVKTEELQPGESQRVVLSCGGYRLASYDETGSSGFRSAYVLEKGDYRFYIGENVRDAEKIYSFSLKQTEVVQQQQQALAPEMDFQRIRPAVSAEKQRLSEALEREKTVSSKEIQREYQVSWEDVPKRQISQKERRDRALEHLIHEMEQLTGSGSSSHEGQVLPEGTAAGAELPRTVISASSMPSWCLQDVERGKCSMETFLDQLSDQELCRLVRGEGMCSPKVTPGVAAAFGGVTEALRSYGIPVGACADGPSGIRMDCGTIAFSMPNGTCIASTFNESLTEKLYVMEGLELRKNKIEALLGPGVNIHRNPLNGRNFEYFSEDPLLTGRMAAAQLRGMHAAGVTGTLKHFACNNQEFSRNFSDSVVSERALREIYLKGFEIAVKEGRADSIMTTYGALNGVWTAGSYDLCTTILRGEWAFAGIVMTDWWAKVNDGEQPASIQNTAAMIRAQNDLYMVTGDSLTNANGDNLEEALEQGTLTRAELLRCGANICRFLIETPAYLRMLHKETELDRELAALASKEEGALGTVIPVEVPAFIPENENWIAIDPSLVDSAAGKNSTLLISVTERGTFEAEFVCRASETLSDLAQLSVSIFKDRDMLEMISLSGEQKEWKRFIIDLGEPAYQYTFTLRMYVPQSGLEIRSLRIRQTGSREAEMLEQLKQERENMN